MPPPPHPHDFMVLEVIASFIIVGLSFLVHYKTKEIYDLSRYKGIKYFRDSFLLFGLAYTLKAIAAVFIIYGMTTCTHSDFLMNFTRSLYGFLSYFITMSGLLIFYSLSYKYFSKKISWIFLFNVLSIIIALFISIFRVPQLILLVNILILVLSIIVFVVVIIKKKNKGHFSKLYIVYALLMLCWTISFVSIPFPKYMIFNFNLITQLLSAIIMAIIFLKVNRALK